MPRCTGAFSTADAVRLAVGNRFYAPRCSAAFLVFAGGAELRSGLCTRAVVCVENMRRTSASAVCGTRDGTVSWLPSGWADVRGYLERLCFSQPWTESGLRSELHNKLAVFCVAEQNGQVLGYAGMQCVMGECYINNIAVFPQFRGMGIGTRLVQMLMEQAMQRNGVFISLEVRVSNQQAISIYRKLGFHEVGCRKNFYTAPVEDGLIMTKEFESQ